MFIGKPHILIVDDDPAIREGLDVALSNTYVVHCAATGRVACAHLRKYPISAIVLDEVLGTERGLDFVQEFRKLSSARVIVLTGYSTEDLAIRAIEVQVDGYQKKPPNLLRLRDALSRLVEAAVPADGPIGHARRLIDAHLERPHTTASLAKEVGLSEAHFRRCFKEACGKTPRRYLTDVRMRRAAERLRSPSAGIAETAYAVGIQSLATFRRLFTRAFGCSPTEFRKRHTPRGNSPDAGEPDSSPSDQS
jgi:YesN/AraC family two-component response regulator